MAKIDKIVDQYTELESQFILRLPPEPAKALRDAIRNGSSLKDRLSIKLEHDVRKGEVRFDNWLLHARVVDLPCIIESLKTIDLKSTYKTADICQMMICKEGEDPLPSDEEEKAAAAAAAAKARKKDPLKVDKKYLWPHGITPPMKNVRHRRFRKTLRKKGAEAPEIEKEIKRLLRGDSDAVSVKWEVISEEPKVQFKEEPRRVMPTPRHKPQVYYEDGPNADVVEHDIFGDVSDSEEDEEIDGNFIPLDEENSRLSGEDTNSRFSDSISVQSQSGRQDLVTEFRGEMFDTNDDEYLLPIVKSETTQGDSSPTVDGSEYQYLYKNESDYVNDFSSENATDSIRNRIATLQMELAELTARREQQELEIANIENLALRQRLQDILDNLLSEQLEKEQQYQELISLLD